MIQEYQTQNTLNPKLWDGDQLKPGLRLKLLKIAKYFYEFLGIDAPIKGIILTGSSVNYNWTENSDIDLHILINYKDINDSIPLVRDYMMAKKSIWNNTYPLKYKGMPIELYAQDENEPHASTGVYCLTCDKWLKIPDSEQVSVDDVEINKKADPYKYEIEQLSYDDPQLMIKINSIKRRLKQLRQTGLAATGEYSIENLAFKELRNSGYLEKLTAMAKDYTYQTLDLGETYADSGLGKWFKEKWVRFDTKGNIKGDCARDEGEGKPKCLPKSKAQSMSKKDRAQSAQRKRRKDPVADRRGKGGKPINVKTEQLNLFLEKNVPTDPNKWAYAKSQAKKKFDVYPSAYANAWASKKYKELGGTWRKSK